MARCLPKFLQTDKMISNTKLLAIVSFLIVISGFGLLWFGLRPSELRQIPEGSALIENKKSTQSAEKGQTFEIEGKKALVTKVIDGDTVELENGNRVRLIGIDTPETKDPRKSVQCFGKEAAGETKRLLEGKAVILQKDVSETDKYSRLLRYIFLPLDNGQILFVNDYLVREGFAKALTYPPDVKYNEQFREAERSARENKRGLWGRC